MSSKAGALTVERFSLRRRRTKIVSTLGPASAKPEVLDRLIAAGVNVFRLNFSHGCHEGHAENARLVREAASRADAPVAILADLCGPKIRVGHFADGGIFLEPSAAVTVTVRKVEGQAGLIPSEYPSLAEDVVSGDRILMADGTRELKVESVEGTEIHCRVVHGGKLTDRKGINLPGVQISAPSLTEKDRKDARFAASLDVDFMALSFVRAAEDVRELRALLREVGKEIPIVSKIEKPEALKEMAEILHETDVVMVARGDLGVEMPAEEVPLIQQELIKAAIEANRQVIVATQMLESMIENPTPTRAEVTDVAWAAMAGADAVMLSGETAVGAHPVEAVSTMDRVLRMVEGHQWRKDQFAHLVKHSTSATDEETRAEQLLEALSRATAGLSRELEVHAITVHSLTGKTAQMIAAERPSAPIVAFTDDETIYRRLALVWGVTPHMLSCEGCGDPISSAPALVKELGLAKEGDFLLLVSNGEDEDRKTPTIRILHA